MNKTQLTEVLATKTNMKKKDAEAAINNVFAAITDALVNGEKVQISGFGSFETKKRAARMGRNPHTHETMEIPAFKSAAFSPSKTLKNAINK
ncbi:MAG: HU family DNA-binding protein [Clostridia bacterium]|nr:HU family DNA-binding protein [Clostridia bacterium]